MNDNFSQQVKDVISYSKEEALRLGHDQIGTEHLLLGIIRDGEGKAISVLEALNVDLDEMRQKIENLNPAKETPGNNIKNLSLTKQAERALKTTFLEAKLFKSPTVNTIHLLLCILRNENDPITKLMNKLDIDYNTVKEEFKFQFQDGKFNLLVQKIHLLMEVILITILSVRLQVNQLQKVKRQF